MNRIDVTVTRIIPATPPEVFDVWVDPTSPGSPWYGTGRAIISAVAVDGLFYHLVKHENKGWHHYGRFVRVERPRLLEYTWVSEGTQGHESTVTVTFEPQEDDTRVTLVHAGAPDGELGRQHEAGWTFVLNEISKAFNARKDKS